MKIVNHATLYYAQSWARSHITLIIWDPSRVTENPFATLRVVEGGARHGSRTTKMTNHESQILKFHFYESR